MGQCGRSNRAVWVEEPTASLAVIQRAYPELAVRSVSLDTGGQRSQVLILNEALVFRFPRTRGGVAALSTEIAILRAIRSRVPIMTPHPAYAAVGDQRAGVAFVGYTLLPGEPLWADTFLEQEDHTRTALVGQLARFLQALHKIPRGSDPLSSGASRLLCGLQAGNPPVQATGSGGTSWTE